MSATSVINIIIDAPAIHIIVQLLKLCTPKQIDLTSVLLLQLPYRVSMLLLTSYVNRHADKGM